MKNGSKGSKSISCVVPPEGSVVGTFHMDVMLLKTVPVGVLFLWGVSLIEMIQNVNTTEHVPPLDNYLHVKNLTKDVNTGLEETIELHLIKSS